MNYYKKFFEVSENISGNIKTIYKYKTYNGCSKQLLIHNEIYLPSCSIFNDPFDAIPPFKFQKASLNVNKLRRFLREDAEKKFGILSLTTKKNDLLMWSHYANDHKGFCIGYDTKKLIDSIDFNDQPIDAEPTACIIRKICYRYDTPEIKSDEENLERVTKLLTTKYIDWQHEDEYRIFKINSCNKSIKLKEGTIKEIILGCKMNNTDKQEIIDITNCNLQSVKILEAKMNSEEFKLIIN